LSGWILAIDVGTTSTAAARRVGDRVETIQLQGGPRMPSLAFWREGTGASGTGRLVLGVEADELSALAPWCLERAPKSRLGEEFIQLGDKQLRPVEIIAAYMVLRGFLPSSGSPGGIPPWVEIAGYAVLVALTPVYLRRLAGGVAGAARQLAIATISFVIWSYAIGGPFFWSALERALATKVVFPGVAGLIAVLWSVSLGAIATPDPS